MESDILVKHDRQHQTKKVYVQQYVQNTALACPAVLVYIREVVENVIMIEWVLPMFSSCECGLDLACILEL